MQPDFTYYSALLKDGKCLSKNDFIYRVKMHCDSTRPEHGNFLNLLYRLHFSLVKKGPDGRIIFLA
jgi:hypothetical protein